MCVELIVRFFRGDRITSISNRIYSIYSTLELAHYDYKKVKEGEPIERVIDYQITTEFNGYRSHAYKEDTIDVPVYETIDYKRPDAARVNSAKKVLDKKIINCRDLLIGEYNNLRIAFCDEYYGKSLEELQHDHKHAFNFMVHVSNKLNQLSGTTDYYNLIEAQNYIKKEGTQRHSSKDQRETFWLNMQKEQDSRLISHAKHN